MNELKIEHNVPLPNRRRHSHGRQTVANMHVGDSVVVAERKHAANLIQLAKRHFPSSRWSQRIVDGGIRVWRVE